MAKYQVQTDQGVFEVETDEPQQQKQGFASTFLNEINPMNSVPAMAKGFVESLRPQILDVKDGGITPEDRTRAAKNLKLRQSGKDTGLIGPPTPEQDVPSMGQTAGHMAAMGVNGGLMALLSEGAVRGAGAIGRGMQKAAVPIAESSLGVNNKQRMFGKSPGHAALTETSGFRPETVAESARQKLGLLNDSLEDAADKATASGARASLNPARDVLDARRQAALAGNSDIAELGQMREQLTTAKPGFRGDVDPATGLLADEQTPSTLLQLKREFNKAHTKWNPLHPSGEMGTARKAYGALARELEGVVPEAVDLNPRISSLVPVAERAEQQALNTGLTGQVLDTMRRPTGALVGTAAGAALGGVPGAIAGAVLPKLVASPASLMMQARALYGTGGLLSNTAAQRAAQGALLSGSRKGLLY